MPPLQSILFVHQSAELYGSDRVLLNLACGLDRSAFKPIVLLPTDGPLAHELRRAGIETHVLELVKVSRSTFGPARLLASPALVRRALQGIDTVLDGRRPLAVYSNTVAVLGGAIWASLRGVPHLWHVHEIVQRPRLAAWGLTRLVSSLSDAVVCNSRPTRDWLVDGRHAVGARTRVVFNGIAPRPPLQPQRVAALRQQLQVADGELLVTLVGRVNAWKGQGLLIDAASRLAAHGHTGLRFAFVGGAVPGPAGEQLLRDLQARMAASPAAGQLRWIDFTADVWPVWDATDIAVVPSTAPEPFGMVAIEAMASGKPVVAAAHGGLLDIVSHDQTGLLVPPNDADALAAAIARLAASPSLRARLGAAGAQRQQAKFSLDAQVDAVADMLRSLSAPPAWACTA